MSEDGRRSSDDGRSPWVEEELDRLEREERVVRVVFSVALVALLAALLVAELLGV